MTHKFICPAWGMDLNDPLKLIDDICEAGYHGIEVNVEWSGRLGRTLIDIAKERGLLIVAQQWLYPKVESSEQYLLRFSRNLDKIARLDPVFINSHTGKDYYTFEENCRIIQVAMDYTRDTGISIYHETHRGRFSFHLASLVPYLKQFPQLKLTADLSHWCAVSESMLYDQEHTLNIAFNHMDYIHCRVGHEHSPQVNDPRAPEWQGHLNRFVGWWERIIQLHQNNNKSEIFLCPEFGPVPYQPTKPFTQVPLANQWDLNLWMLNLLKTSYNNVKTDNL